MPVSNRSHVLRCVALLAGVYLSARLLGATGPGVAFPVIEEILYPAAFIIVIWGLSRLKANRGDPCV